MTPARIRLLLSALLFVAWIGFLGYLVLGTERPALVVSRPQVLVSELDVIAHVEGLDQPVTIEEVRFPEADAGKVGATVRVTNLKDSVGFRGPGRYILPLVKRGKDEAFIAPIPSSPGFSPMPGHELARPRIYPATHETLEQLSRLPKAVGAVEGR